VIPIGDTISDILLMIEWCSQGHVKWPVALIFSIALNSMVTTVGHWASKLDNCSLRKRCIRWPLYLFGFGPCLQVPETVKHIGTRSEEYQYYCFLFTKILEVISEATPSLLVTSYATAIALYTDKRAPDVTPFTAISLSFSMISISSGWAALSVFEREVSFVRLLFILFVNCCEIYVSLMTPALIVVFLNWTAEWTYLAFFVIMGFIYIIDLWLQGPVKLSVRLLLFVIVTATSLMLMNLVLESVKLRFLRHSIYFLTLCVIRACIVEKEDIVLICSGIFACVISLIGDNYLERAWFAGDQRERRSSSRNEALSIEC